MSDFQPDLFQRVKYSVGLVLGVDEFEQEQAYLRGHEHLHHRYLHGYGTVSGLKVTTENDQVIVSPGLAIDPLGRPVRVQAAQMGHLTDWLSNPSNAQTLDPPTTHGHQSVYVVLHQVETDTNQVALPGPPGRSEKDSVVYARVTESSLLNFAPSPPSHGDDEATRLLGTLLSCLNLATDVEGITPHQMETLVRSLLSDKAPLPKSGSIAVRPDRSHAVLQALLRVWVTEVRPALVDEATPGREALLLARIDFKREADGTACHLRIVEEGRPFLLPTHLLQNDLLRHAFHGLDGTAAALQPPVYRPDPVTVVEPPPAPAVVGHSVHPFVTISRVTGAGEPTVELWFHLPTDIHAIQDPFQLYVFAEPVTHLEAVGRATPPTRITVMEVRPNGRNKLIVVLDETAANHPHLRFEFRLHAGLLSRLLAEVGGTWLGYDGQSTVVAFHHYQPVYEVVAVGVVEKGHVIKGRHLTVEERGASVYLLKFPAYRPDETYMVKGTPIVHASDYQRTFEVLRHQHEPGILVRVPGFDTGFMVEISRIL